MTILGFLTALLVGVALFFVIWALVKRSGTAPAETMGTTSARQAGFNWRGWGIAIFVLALAGWWWVSNDKPKAPPQTATVPARPERVIEVIAPVGQWSENVSILPRHWFRIIPEGKIRIRTWDGREFDDEPGKTNWLGDEVRDANFRFQSMEERDLKIFVVLVPK